VVTISILLNITQGLGLVSPYEHWNKPSGFIQCGGRDHLSNYYNDNKHCFLRSTLDSGSVTRSCDHLLQTKQIAVDRNV